MSRKKQKSERPPAEQGDLFDNRYYRIYELNRLQNDNEQHILDKQDMQEKLDKKDVHIQGLQDVIDKQDEHIHGLQEKLDRKRVRMQGLQVQLDQCNKDKEAMKSVIEGLEKEITRLLGLLDEKNEKDLMIKFSLIQIVEYCKQCAFWGDARPIVHMLNKFLRLEGTPEDIDLVDSIEDEFKNRQQGLNITDSEITFKDTQINGSMYEVKNNSQVNLGNQFEETSKDHSEDEK